MFKKFLIAFTFALLAVPAVDSFAYSYLIYEQYGAYDYEIYDNDPVPIVTLNTSESQPRYDVYARLLSQGHGYSSADAALDAALIDDNLDFNSSVAGWGTYLFTNPLFFGTFVNNTGSPLPMYKPPEPDPPEPGSTWLSDLWEWFLWQLGLNDDYSGDIDAYITGGDRDPFELITPSPTLSPTPVPSPTPYSLDILDNNGNHVYTITGIPGSTYNINNTTNNNDGSDFDIFEVDLQIGDGGSSNPRDGLNDVMDTSLTYLSDPDNVDMQPVGDSFSIIPNDWFLLLGVVACFPFIAGFISKLLK